MSGKVLFRIACVVVGCLTILLTGKVQAENQNDSSICVYVFTNMDCDDCLEVVEQYVVPYQVSHHLRVELRDVNNDEVYAQLLAAEKFFGRTSALTPVIVLQDAIFHVDDIKGGAFLEKITALQGHAVPFFDFSRVAETLSRKVSNDADVKPTEGVFFYQDGCKECRRVERDLVRLLDSYAELHITYYNIADPEACLLYQYLANEAQLPDADVLKTPGICIGSAFIVGKDVTYLALEPIVERYRYEEIADPYDTFSDARRRQLEDALEKRFATFRVLPVFVGGLIDGINPCAFATIIFFVTYLLTVTKNKKDIVLVGVTYITVVFITYLVIGIGGLHILQTCLHLPIVQRVVRGVYVCMAVLLFSCAYLSFADSVGFITNGKQSVLLQLSEAQKNRIRYVIRTRLTMRYCVVGAAVCGFFVSLTELACTGQVYLPTILYILKMGTVSRKAFLFLILYNGAFILPLVCVFLLTFKGFTAVRFAQLSKKTFVWAKILLGVFFTVLGALLLVSM